MVNHRTPPMTRVGSLVELADAINELTRRTTHVEYVEHTITRTVTTRSGKIHGKRTRERRRHTTSLPPLLSELEAAAVPGSGEAGGLSAFESRPAAELAPLSVLREIADDAGFWARTFAIDEPDLASTLQSLVSAPADPAQLERLTQQATRWVRRARLATGRDPQPVTITEPCPYCLRRHALVIAGDLQHAKCSRCGTRWTPDTIGLLADMLRTNTTQETAVAVPCWMADCTRRGPHDLHQDARGRTWTRGDRCIGEDGQPVRG